MTRSRILALAASLLWPLPAQAADEPTRLAASTDWVVDYADERCSLHRGFGEGEHSVNLRIDWFGPRPEHRVLLVGSAVPKSASARGEIAVRLTPDAELRPGYTINGTFLDQPAVSFNLTFLPFDPAQASRRMSAAEQMAFQAVPRMPQPEFEKEVRTLEVQFAEGTVIELELGRISRPLEVLRACMDNLVRVWGLDPAVQGSLSRNAVAKPSTVRRLQREYPSDMLAGGMNAFVPVRVMVAADGSVSECVVQSEGIEESFRDAVCDGLARGYEPALDSNGNPVASVFPTSVVYMVQ